MGQENSHSHKSNNYNNNTRKMRMKRLQHRRHTEERYAVSEEPQVDMTPETPVSPMKKSSSGRKPRAVNLKRLVSFGSFRKDKSSARTKASSSSSSSSSSTSSSPSSSSSSSSPSPYQSSPCLLSTVTSTTTSIRYKNNRYIQSRANSITTSTSVEITSSEPTNGDREYPTQNNHYIDKVALGQLRRYNSTMSFCRNRGNSDESSSSSVSQYLSWREIKEIDGPNEPCPLPPQTPPIPSKLKKTKTFTFGSTNRHESDSSFSSSDLSQSSSKNKRPRKNRRKKHKAKRSASARQSRSPSL